MKKIRQLRNLRSDSFYIDFICCQSHQNPSITHSLIWCFVWRDGGETQWMFVLWPETIPRAAHNMHRLARFIVDSPKLKNVYLRRDRLDRTDDFDVFELLGQHMRKEITDWSSPHTSLVRSVPSANLLQLCHVKSPFNRTNREEEDSNLTEAQL